MDNPLPKVKTIRIMFQEMGGQQEAMFRMAFKLHKTTNYEIVTPDSPEQPDLILVDTDTEQGIETWKTLKNTYAGIPVAMFCSGDPSVTTPYLNKEIKFDTLFPILRSLAQGGHVFEVAEHQADKNRIEVGSEGLSEHARKATIRRFNPQKGLLGALHFASQGHQDIAILHEGRPVLIVFPNIQRVLLTVGAADLEKLCRDDNLTVVCKAVPDNPQWKEKAKVTIMSCLWQMAIWTAQGRLIYPMTPQTVFTLKRWPNLTRLAYVPESMRLSAFLTKTSVNLNILYKVMPLGMPDILNYLAATSVTGFLMTDDKQAASSGAGGQAADLAAESRMTQAAKQAAAPLQEQPRGLLQRLMRKLLGKV